MFKYRIYGLNVLSNHQLDCYLSDFVNASADIVLEFTDSEESAGRYIEELNLDEKPVEFGAPDGLGKLYFCGDKHIVVCYQTEDALERFLIHVLFGFGFSNILLRRRIFFLHGSSVTFGNEAIVIVGSSGAGKSTLAAGFVQHGGKIITDDMTRLELNTKKPFVYPGYPVCKLWNSAIDYFGFNKSGAIEVMDKKGKYQLDGSQFSFLDQCVSVEAIVCLEPSEIREVCIIRNDIKQSILVLCNNFYNSTMILNSSSKSNYYDFLLTICEKIPVFTLYRPKNILAIKEQVDVIMREILHKG